MDIQYIAGFFDGEGSVKLPRNTTCVNTGLSIVNTDRLVLEKIKEFLGCGVIYNHGIPKKWGKKPIFSFQIKKRHDVIETLQKMLPYLEVKHASGQKLLEFLTSKPFDQTEWTTKEDTILREHYKKQSTTSIAKELKRSPGSIYIRAQILGLSKKIEWKPWTSVEIDFIKENYNKMTYQEIAKILGRTYYSVESMLRKKIGIVKFKAVTIGTSRFLPRATKTTGTGM